MSISIKAARTETAVPINLSINRQFQGGVTGLSPTFQIRDGATDDSYLDFSDLTFKSTGWISLNGSLAEVGGGFYTYTGGLDVSAITNLPAGTETLAVEYTVDNGGKDKAISMDIIQLNTTATDLATLITAAVDAAKFCENRMRFDPDTQILTLYEADGTTPFKEWTLFTDQGEDVISPIGVQTERVPVP